MPPEAFSKIARKRASLRRSASSAVLRAVLSILMPTIFMIRPSASRIGVARDAIQRTCPSGAMSLKSISCGSPVAIECS